MKSLTLYSCALGAVYEVFGVLSLCNWVLQALLGGTGLLEEMVPGDIGLAVVLLSVGLSLMAAAYYYTHRDHVRTQACMLVGSGLGAAALLMQLLATLAAYLDGFVVGEILAIHDVATMLLRVDSLLGALLLPLLVASIRLVRASTVKAS